MAARSRNATRRTPATGRGAPSVSTKPAAATGGAGRAARAPEPSLTERAYREIKRRVLTLAYRPGQFLNESGICTELGIGRTPVHEALHRLKVEGLVDVIPRKGILVRPDSLNEVMSLLEARLVVEPYCLGLAAERATPETLATLQAILAESRKAIAGPGGMEAFMALDIRFHETLARAAGNAVLADMMRLLHERATRLWYLQVWGSGDLRLTQGEHEAIFAAVKRGDKTAAVAAAQAHLSSLRRRIVSGAG